MAANNPKALLGKTLQGGFKLERLVGAGAFAWVFYARSPRGEGLAVKIQHNHEGESGRHFLREIKVMRQLPPNAHSVRYVAEGRTEANHPFLVMEFVDGVTLKEGLKAKPVWAESEACQLMVQLCDAFAGLHQLGLAHRDIKPDNIMLTRDWRVKLTDFGLVKDAQGLLRLFEEQDIVEGKDFADNIEAGMLVGTPEYMAPEQFTDSTVEHEHQAQTDTWTDVYSLGLIFYQLLTGKKLFEFSPTAKDQGGYAREFLAYIRLRSGWRDDDLKRPEVVGPALWSVIAKTVRQNPKDRQRNAAELGADIRRYVESGQGIEAEQFESTHAVMDMAKLLAEYEAAGGDEAAAAGKPGGSMIGPLPDFEETNPFDMDAVQTKLFQDLAQPTVAPGMLTRAKDKEKPREQPAPGKIETTRVSDEDLVADEETHERMSVPPEQEPVPARASEAQGGGSRLGVWIGVGVVIGLAAVGAAAVLMRMH